MSVNSPTMQSFNTKIISQRVVEAIQLAEEKFKNISANKWSEKSSPEKWSKKQILGHLIDSAANNYQRFIRAQFVENEYTGPGYEQDVFVTVQDFQNENTENLIQLWVSFNKHLAHVIANASPEKLSVICRIGNYEPQTLGFVMNDYVDHLHHHLQEIFK